MHKKRLHPGLTLLLVVFIFGSVLIVGFLKPGKPAHAVPPDDWSTYLYNPGHSGFNSAETAINPNTAGSLKQLWTISEGTTIPTQPVVVNGKIYWGSWDGIEHATNLNGSQAWTANLGTVTSSSCGGATLGIVSAATVATVTINGTPTSVVFVGGGNTQFYALNATTGAVIWHTPIGTPPNDVIWSSPVLYNGSLYISTASLCDNPLTQAQIFRLDSATGAIQNTFNVVPNGCVGAGVWGSETIDTSNGTLYFASGNGNNCPQTETNAVAVVQLNASNLTYMSSWQIPPAQQGTDSDFGSTPTLFTATIGGTLHHLLGVANKNGTYYAFDEANIAQGPVWTVTLAQGGPGPESGDGSISPSAWDGTTLYVGGGRTTINGQNCQGGLRALNPATGAVLWAQCMTDGPIIGAVTAVPGVVAVAEGTALWLMATSDGHSLFKTWDTSNGSLYYAAPTIANGVVYTANKNGKFSAYGLGSPPSPTPNPSPTASPSPTPTPPPAVSGPVSKQWYFAEGRAGAGFKEFLTLGNPTNNACQVNIEYLYAQDRGTAQTKTVSVSVPAAQRVTEWVDGDLGTQPTGTGITDSAIVTVDNNATPNCSGIVAERPMYFNALGVNSGSDELGVTHTGTTFYFADVATGPQVGGGSYSSFIPILNPGAASATVTATYYANGQQVGTQQAVVPAGTRGTIFPSSAIPSLPPHTAVVLNSTQPVVIERPTYFSNINGGNAGTVSGAADVIGVQNLANDWLFAEGYTGGQFQENFVIANLDAAKSTANVTINMEYTDGTTHAFSVTVNPLSQLIWNVNTNATGATSQSVSAEITSSGANIVVEREMFFKYNHVGNGRTLTATGGTDVIGQVGPAAATSYSFAEGYTNTGYDEWLTMQNPTANTEIINITLVNAVGTVYTFSVQVVAHSRYTVDIVGTVIQHLFHNGDGYNGFEVSMAVQSSNGPFVVERPMYWNASGTQGGSDIIGYIGG
jgi:outer membrane protein assembly factor BamB